MNRVFASLILTCATWQFVPLTVSAATIDLLPVSNSGNVARDPKDVPTSIGFRVANIQVPPPVAAWTGASSTSFADIGNWTGAVPGAIASTKNTDTVLFNQNAPNSPLAIDAQ